MRKDLILIIIILMIAFTLQGLYIYNNVDDLININNNLEIELIK